MYPVPPQNNSQLIIPDILQKDSVIKETPEIINNFERTGPTIQLAVLLDTSGSMDGLINQARTHIWKIINELSKANKNNKDVTIQVGLYEYGKSSISREEGHLRKLVPLTTELDLLSDKLFSLRTNGGDEFAGKVILSSINELQWSNHKDDLKLILIAGNESFLQGDVDFKYAINKAKNNNIIVNTIFCGDYNKGIRLNWKEGADLGNGKYMNINQDQKVIHYTTKYDQEIMTLGQKLNKTYVSVSKQAKLAQKRQIQQDMNSMVLSESVAVERSISKAGNSYKNSWDSVSNFISSSPNKKEKTIKELKESEEFSNKNEEEIEEILIEKTEERKKIQDQINELNKLREKDIEKQKQNQKLDKSVGDIIINNMKEIMNNNGFKF